MSADGVSLTDEQIDERLDAIQAAIETAIRAARDVRSYCASEIATTKAASLCAERADADNERCMVYKAGIRATHDAYLALITTYDDSAAKWLETGLENDNDLVEKANQDVDAYDWNLLAKQLPSYTDSVDAIQAAIAPTKSSVVQVDPSKVDAFNAVDDDTPPAVGTTEPEPEPVPVGGGGASAR